MSAKPKRQEAYLSPGLPIEVRIIQPGTLDCPDERCEWTNPANWSPGAEGYLAAHLAHDPRHTDREWIDSDRNRRRGFAYMHRCADFKSKDYGAAIVTDETVYPRHWYEEDIGQPVSEFWCSDDELEGWDRISVHGYESCEGITSGHVYKFVDDGVIIGDIVVTW